MLHCSELRASGIKFSSSELHSYGTYETNVLNKNIYLVYHI
jgi:hypothetical protein